VLSRVASSPAGVVVVTSPLQRACQTARVIADRFDVEVVVDERLIELDYGDLEGVPIGDVTLDTWRSWRKEPSWRPPGGESLAQVQERVASFCEGYGPAARTRQVIAVSHVSPIKAAACWAMGAPAVLSWRMSLPVASITQIATDPPALRSFGETEHLLEAGLLREPRGHLGPPA
jgi:probable phosphoglycerate mutase